MDGVICEVKGGGVLGGNKNVKLPSGKHEHMPVLTHQDQEDLQKLISSEEVHYVAVPYAVRKRDTHKIRTNPKYRCVDDGSDDEVDEGKQEDY